MADANVRAVITADDRASNTIAGVGNSFGKLAGAMAVGQLAANAVTRAFDALVSVGKQSVGMAFEQVRSVENATMALRAYEKDGAKVNAVLKDLIAYARSDLGVLFQREDLFAAAQTLKLYGQTTDTLVDKVKILSKGVSLGKTSFQELSSIVGRAAAKGRLDAVDFDMLIERGIGLDKSFRGATVTSEELFKALNNALPDELLKGRANTIDGLMIRLQSAFRDVGSAILGVNTETSEFIKGGLGDQFMQWIKQVTEFLKQPGVQEWFRNLASSIAENLPKAIEWVRQFVQSVDWKAVLNATVLIIQGIAFMAQQIAGSVATIKAVMDQFIEIGGLLLFAWQSVLRDLNSAFRQTRDGIISDFNAVRDFLTGIPGWVKAAFGGLAGAMIAPFAAAFTGIVSLWNNTVGRINFKVPDWVPGIGGKSIAVPKFASGTDFFRGGNAIVGERGPEMVTLPRGSKIHPADETQRMMGGGSTINITVQAGAFMGSQQDARRYAQQIADALKDVAAMNGTTPARMLG